MDDFFARVASIYDPLARYSINALRHMSQDLSAFVPACYRMMALDAGAGTGFPSAAVVSPLSNAGGVDLVLLDRSRAMLRHAIHSPAISLLPVVGDATALPFNDSCFSIAMTFCALHCFSSKAGFLAESHRVLHSDGLILIAFNDREELKRQLVHRYFPNFHARDRERQCTVNGVQSLVEESGFVLLRQNRQDWVQRFDTVDAYIRFIRERPFSGFAFYGDDEFSYSLREFRSAIENLVAHDAPVYNEGSIDWVLARKST